MNHNDDAGLDLDLEIDEIDNTNYEGQPASVALATTTGTSEDVIDRYSHCHYCGGRLHFVQITDFSRNTTQEKASCPECGLHTQQMLHRLQ